MVDLLDDWVRRDAPRLDADNDGLYDEASPAIMDALWHADRQGRDGPGARRACSPDVDSVRGLGGLAGESYVDKDLRTLLGDHVDGAVQPALLRRGLAEGVPRLALVHARTRPRTSWRRSSATRIRPRGWATASRTGFQPGLIPNTMRTTNRPTFQQVLEFQHPRGRRGR